MFSSRSGRRSKSTRKHSKAESYSSHNSPPPTEEEPGADDDGDYEIEDDAAAASATTWPPPSFLFTINELPVNEDPQSGGLPPRVNEDRQWIPPIYGKGFYAQQPGRLYRWADDGRISLADECRWSDSGYWCSRSGTGLLAHRTSTMFWCNNWTQFVAAPGDASMRDMASSDASAALDRWWPLNFFHDGSLSRIDIPGDEVVLAGTGSWIHRLGLDSYSNRDASDSGGLAGNLALVIALIAFSCEARALDTVLREDRAWRHRRWRGHHHRNGRIDARGIVVTIYLDPENPQGSTSDTISALEWSGDRLL